MNPPFQPHQIPLLCHPLPRRPLQSQSQWRLCLRPSPRLISSRFLRCWQPFGRTERQTLLQAARQAIPVRPLSQPACRQLIHRFRLRVAGSVTVPLLFSFYLFVCWYSRGSSCFSAARPSVVGTTLVRLFIGTVDQQPDPGAFGRKSVCS